MGLRPGYKQTEVGVIPEEWEVKPLGDMFEFSGGVTASRDQLSAEGYCYLHYGDIHKSEKTFIDVQAEFLDIPKLAVPLKQISPKFLVKDGDIVFVDASEDDEGTSKHVVVINQADIPYISGLHTIVAKSKDASLDNRYKQFCFQTADIKRQFYFYAVGTKVSGISKTNIAKLILPLPRPAEQRAIAVVLGDVDELIGALTGLIAKNRDLKQAAMQRLLTSQIRLPGFSGEWEVMRLGNVFQFLNTANNPRSDLSDLGDVGYIHYGDIHTTASAFLDCSETTLPLIAKSKVANISFVQDGDLVMADASEDYAGIGKCVEVENTRGRRIVAGLHTFLLRGDKNLIADGFKGYLQFIRSVRAAMVRLATGISVFGISKGNVRSIEVALPRVDEQKAIAEVLSDMDAEIEALGRRLAKTRALKQGMMQELLTGRTRLI